ncbi:chemotaxis protein CheW [Thauera aminoaromatica]|uniref:Chemotaxis protein CheA n=1 Tax=Thauera aminoaromatica TaxID=164330 RepID=A0A5C7T7J7_THASP|nr:chemotaxis protein CheW [Thauera aminoaromatica]TXH92164.1 MAG: chemotaxis protein CheA [Thauera aminoaromatica]
MAIDMSQFYQVFFEEAAEHLASMEALLLAINPAAPDPEEVNALFRAAHSIKGSSGTFGFQDMMEVTHILETMLDRVRKGEAPLTDDMVDASLVAGDVLKNLLGAHRGEEEPDRAAAEAICHRLEALCRALDSPPGPTAAPLPVPGGVPIVSAPAPGAEAGYDLHFRISGEPGAVSGGLASLVDELGSFGRVETIAASPDAGGECHLRIVTEVSPETLAGVVDFVADAASLRIEAFAAPAQSAEEEAYGFFTELEQVVDEAYGFFEPLPELPAVSEPYGLFSNVEVAVEPYGFFTELPLPEQVPTPVATAPAGETAYGFFEPIAPSPVQLPSAEAPAVQPPAVVAELPPATVKKAPAKPAGAGDTGSIRVSVEKVDQMINLVGELVITQAMLTQAASNVDPVVFERLINGLAQLERNTRDLQESVMSIRMMPISVVFSRFPRVVRDLSQKLGKQVELKTIGETTEMDKSLVERITDPLTHLVRNSLDHGLETPERRRAAGKPETGTITLSAYHQSGNIVIEVGDDGAGLNRARILAKAKERGMAVSDAMSDQEVWQLIMEPGFSTAEQVTEVSGRGVGMDVVKKNISAMGGRIELESMTGVGTRITVRLPLTLAILDGMSVGVGPETYIIPLGYVMESMQPERGMMKSVSGVERLIQVRGEYLPVICLHEVFHITGAITDWSKGIMVVLEADGQSAALFIDQLIGQHQVVIKSLEANYRRVPGIAGATIMGDGRVALILDVPVLVDMARRVLPAAA